MMRMSTHIQGFKAPDERWKAMKAVWESCELAGIEPPEEVIRFFEGEKPDERGVEVKIKNTSSCKEWGDDHRSGYEVDLRDLPPDLTHLRFFNSW